MVPKQIPSPSPNDIPQVFPAEGKLKMRVALMIGCAQRALNTNINDATIRLPTRHGCKVVITKGEGCCGTLTHHMGQTKNSHTQAKKVSSITRDVSEVMSELGLQEPEALQKKSQTNIDYNEKNCTGHAV